MPPVAAPLDQRFWAKVDKRGPDDCWLWTGATLSQNGYGSLSGPRNANGWPTARYAHRVSWELTHGAIQPGQSVLHACDVPRCVNPNHLFLGTQRDNNQDAARKGRFHVQRPRGQRVTDEQVAEIKRLSAAGVLGVTLATRFGVSETYISLLLHAKRRQLPQPRLRRSA